MPIIIQSLIHLFYSVFSQLLCYWIHTILISLIFYFFSMKILNIHIFLLKHKVVFHFFYISHAKYILIKGNITVMTLAHPMGCLPCTFPLPSSFLTESHFVPECPLLCMPKCFGKGGLRPRYSL